MNLEPATETAAPAVSNPSAGRFFGLPILFGYVLREMLTPFFVALFVFTGVLFLARVLKLIDLIVNKSVPVGDIILLFSYVIPGFLELAIPMALLLGILLAFGRLSSDSELVVMRAVGISMKQLAKPVMSFAVMAFFVSLAIGFWIRPWANYRLGIGLFEIVKLKTSSGLTAGIFNDMGPLTIYAESLDDQTGRLTNVIIADRRDPEMNRNFLARYGQIISDNDDRTLSLQLYDGSIQEGAGLNFNVTSFDSNQIKLPQTELLDEGPTREGKHANELYIGELLDAMKALSDRSATLDDDDWLQLARYRVEFQKRLVIPFSAFCVALAAMALGIQPSRGGKTWGTTANVTLGIALILSYYILLALVSALGSHAFAPPWLLMWIPNILFSALGLYLFRQIGNERWQAVSQAIGDVFTRLTSRFGGATAKG
ncbi:MAG: LPS export ABC transporter permease LptF [Bdellovibrionota bacterium]